MRSRDGRGTTLLEESPRPWKIWLRSSASLATLLAALLFAARVPPFSLLETWLGDLRLALLAPSAPPHPKVAVVEINEATAAKIGRRSPVDRGLLAKLIDTVASAEPAAIGIDVLFDEPSEPEKDAALLAALHRVRVPVVLGWIDAVNAPGAIEHWQETYLENFIKRIDNPLVVPGLSVMREDRDGVVRQLVLRVPAGTVRETFDLLLSKSAGGAAPPGLTLPLAYYGHPFKDQQPFIRFPAHLLFPEMPQIWRVQSSTLAHRVVLIGANLLNVDLHRTPFASDPLTGQSATPGVYLQAQGLAQLLDGREVEAVPSWVADLLIAGLAAFGFLIGRREMAWSLRVTVGFATIMLLLAAAGAIFHYGGATAPVVTPGPIFPLVMPTAGFLIAMTIGIAHARQLHAAERRFIRSVLTRYVPSEVVDHLLFHPEDMKLGGERRMMSFVYTDISGFTTLCESADPKALVPALNRYLSGMTSIIYDHKGTVAGFIGDAVLAFWGAPLDDPEQAVHALRSALAMNRFAKEERRKAAAEGLDFGRTRIGVHRGLATVGNFGGAARLEYMAHGDAVNTVARLEGANKYFNTDIAASEAVVAEAGDIPLRPVGDVMLRGKAHSVAVFAPAADDSPGLADYCAAFELLRQGSPQALGAFEALHRRQPEDPLAAFHLERLRRGETGITIVLEDK